MKNSFLHLMQSPPLRGTCDTVGAKNAVLVIIASLLLTQGKSTLYNVPSSADVEQMIALLKQLGAHVSLYAEEHRLEVDTSTVNRWCVPHEIMKKMRASILVMGPLLGRFGRADIAMPGGCVIGARPIDYHLKSFARMGVRVEQDGEYLHAFVVARLFAQRIILEYPSVGATENILMAATLTAGITSIVNAALEPEVLDLIAVLQKMGAQITIVPPATILIQGVEELKPVVHTIIPDRLEAGALLMAAAISGGEITLPSAPAHAMEVFLMKLEEMGHEVIVAESGFGISLKATEEPRAVSFKTGPYPGFPTDLQAPMMALQTIAQGVSEVYETVFENRLLHAPELAKMGAQIRVEHNKAIIVGVDELYGASVIATDIRASCALALAGLVAQGNTFMTGIHHWKRGYEALEEKLISLGARLTLHEENTASAEIIAENEKKERINHHTL